MEILQSWLPRRYPKTWHSGTDISDLGFLFLNEKNQNLLDIQNSVFANWGKYELSWDYCLVFIIIDF